MKAAIVAAAIGGTLAVVEGLLMLYSAVVSERLEAKVRGDFSDAEADPALRRLPAFLSGKPYGIEGSRAQRRVRRKNLSRRVLLNPEGYEGARFGGPLPFSEAVCLSDFPNQQAKASMSGNVDSG